MAATAAPVTSAYQGHGRQPGPAAPGRPGGPPTWGGGATGPGDGPQLGQDRRLAGQLTKGRRGRRRRQRLAALAKPGGAWSGDSSPASSH